MACRRLSVCGFAAAFTFAAVPGTVMADFTVDLGSGSLVGNETRFVDVVVDESMIPAGSAVVGFELSMDYVTNTAGSWASDMGFWIEDADGNPSVQTGGFNVLFADEVGTPWSFDGPGSAASGSYSDSVAQDNSGIGTWRFSIGNAWSTSPAVEYNNVVVDVIVEEVFVCPPDYVPNTYAVASIADLVATIEVAVCGDVIELAAGTYMLDEQILVDTDSEFTIRGVVGKDGGLLTILDGGSTTRIMNVDAPDVTVRDLVFQNANTSFNGPTDRDGAAILCRGLHLIENCVFQNNIARNGGGALCLTFPQDTLVNDCVFDGNTATFGGAIFHPQNSNTDPTSPTITNSMFIGNTGTGTGGAVAAGGSGPTYDGCHFEGNANLVQPSADFPGGFAWAGGGCFHFNAGGSPSVINSQFFDNTVAGGQCGAVIWVGSVTNPVVIGNLLLCENTCNGVESDFSGGPYDDIGGNEICDLCPADLNGDGQVNGADLGFLIGFWDCCGSSCTGDINDDGCVDGADLAELLGNWGPCPE